MMFQRTNSPAAENSDRKRNISPPRRRGAISTEYLLVLGLVVIPLAAMLPLFIRMIQQYAERVSSLMRLPFP
jgi:uncharacterized protein (UPF0333 family)